MVVGDLKQSNFSLFASHLAIGGGDGGPLPLPGNYLWQTNRQLQLIISPPLPAPVFATDSYLCWK